MLLDLFSEFRFQRSCGRLAAVATSGSPPPGALATDGLEQFVNLSEAGIDQWEGATTGAGQVIA